MRHSALPLAVALALGTTAAAQVVAPDPATSYLFRVPLPIPPALHAVLHARYDVLHAHSGTAPAGQPLDVVVLPGELDGFLALAPRARLIERGRPYHQIAAASPADPDPGYYTVAEIEQEIDSLAAAYPTLAAKVDLTALPGAVKTHGGRSIYALKVSDAVGLDEDEPAALVIAQHHARELNAPHMVIQAMKRVLQGYATDPQLRAAVDESELYFVPMVNPDGVDWVWNVDNFWRKNRRNNGGGSYGVDLNRNYPTQWSSSCGGSTQTSSQTYRGPTPASEPEVRTMRAAVEALRPELYIDFHSYGQEVLHTYSPCSSRTATINSFIQGYADDLRSRMSYALRAPSAGGEAPEDHWRTSGTMSFLIEVGTSFQPSFASTVAEEARVWPGLHRVLTAWQPAVRGHVTSLYRGEPVAATITIAPSPFVAGEHAVSRARDGRYGLWLPNGTWQVTFAAAGFEPATRTVTVTAQMQSQALDVVLVPAWPPATLQKTGPDRVGTTSTLTYQSPGDAGNAYWIALAGGTTPGLPIGPRTLPLAPDALFAASLNLAPILTGNVGTLDPAATGQAAFHIPPLPALAGITLYSAGITFAAGYPEGVQRWSPAVAIAIQP